MRSHPLPSDKALGRPAARASETALDREAAAETDARMGITADEIQAWIDSWGTPNPLPMPTARLVK